MNIDVSFSYSFRDSIANSKALSKPSPLLKPGWTPYLLYYWVFGLPSRQISIPQLQRWHMVPHSDYLGNSSNPLTITLCLMKLTLSIVLELIFAPSRLFHHDLQLANLTFLLSYLPPLLCLFAMMPSESRYSLLMMDLTLWSSEHLNISLSALMVAMILFRSIASNPLTSIFPTHPTLQNLVMDILTLPPNPIPILSHHPHIHTH